jgi:hypothetical protein
MVVRFRVQPSDRFIPFEFRTVKYPNGVPKLKANGRAAVEESNKVNAAMWKLCDIAHDNGVKVSIENPGSSILWHTREFLAWEAKTGASMICLDYCMFGKDYKKNTKFYVTAEGFESMAKRCEHDKGVHAQLSGWKDLKNLDRKMVPTAKEAGYPIAFCSGWAKRVQLALGMP